MIRQKRFILLLIAMLMGLALACNLSGGEEEPVIEPTATNSEAVVVPTNPPAQEPTAEQVVETVVETVVVVATPTLLPTEAPASSDTDILDVPAPSSGEPTVTSLVDLNVRTGPGTNYPVVGALPAGTSAAITGKSPDGFWWKINCPGTPGGECWTSAGANYSSATNASGVQVAAVPPAPTHAATATYTYTPSSTVGATSTYPPETATAIYLTGTPTYTATPPDNATATYTPTYTPTPPTNVTGTPTATYTPSATYTATATDAAPIAPFDNDSLQNPAISVFLSITGNREFSYSDAISYSGGDNDDWIEFEFPNNSNSNQNVFITLNCELSGNVGNAQGRLTIYEDQQQTNKIVLCNEGEVTLTVNNTQTQQGRIHFGVTNEGVYMTYTVTVVGFR